MAKRKGSNTRLYIYAGAAAALLLGMFLYCRGGGDAVNWRIAKIDKGEIRQRVSATGTLSAVLEVDVGTQVSGMVTSLNADYNSIVKKDQIIATIDTTIPAQQVRTEEINVERSKTNLDDAERQFKRYQALAAEKLVSSTDLESREVVYRTSLATYDNALISLERARANLGYCTIKAPVDGVVVSRKADVGQTVTASMSTPSLFIIAQDLRQMKLEISIDEADISQVSVGQRANFTVDSIPDVQFSGTVSQVRLEPITNQNVVSYKVVVEVQNQTKQEIDAQKERRGGPRGGGGGQDQQGPQGQQGQGGSPANSATAPAGPSDRGDKAVTPPPKPQGKEGQGGPGGQTEGARQVRLVGPDGSPIDLDAMWERIKDRVQERQPGLTKEAWMEQRKEHHRQMEQQAAESMRAGPQGDGTPSAPAPSPSQPGPSGIFKAGGPFYQGEYALRPGMTANVIIITNQKSDILRVPNNALRFDPSPYVKLEANQGQPDQPNRSGAAQQQRPMTLGGGPMMFGGGGQNRGGGGRGDRGMVTRRDDRVWTLDEKRRPKSISVRVGLTDGQFTEITAEGISEGMDVLVGVDDAKKNASAAANPFQMGGGGGGRR
jgi:RND family efflux transporter MFP subunit